MYRDRRIVVIAPTYDEEKKIVEVVRRMPADIVDLTVVVDDGSSDGTSPCAREAGAHVIRHERRQGVGAAIRTGFTHALRENFDLVVVIAGNNKDDPSEIPRLLDPICEHDYDFVMGSRFLSGGAYGGEMPLYRKLATRLHPFLVGLFCGKKLTESTNGFRGMKTSILRDPRIDLQQSWLDGYELEVYLLMRVLRLGYRTTEVPCTKIYPPKRLGNTKMRPILDWWNMLRPIFLVGLGIKK